MAVLPVLLISCGTSAEFKWVVEIAMSVPHKLGSCAVGDLDGEKPGNEIVAVGQRGDIHMAWRDSTGWKQVQIAQLPGEMIQCAIGDADPSRPGNEVVAVGMKQGGEDDGGPGAVVLVYRSGDEWKHEVILEDSALVHAVCIGELDPDHAGPEILVAGYGLRAHVLSGAKKEVIQLSGPGKSAVAFRGGVAVACKDGTIVLVTKTNGLWTTEEIDRAPAGHSRIGTDGDRLISSRDDGVLSIVDNGQRTEIHKEESKLRGAVFADFDPRADGLEAATAGYTKTITVLRKGPSAWRAEVIYTDTDRFHHVAAGSLPPWGVALAACGYSGRVVVAWNRINR